MNESPVLALYQTILNKNIRLRWEESTLDVHSFKYQYRYYKPKKRSMYALSRAIIKLASRSREVTDVRVEIASRATYYWFPIPLSNVLNPEDWRGVGDIIEQNQKLQDDPYFGSPPTSVGSGKTDISIEHDRELYPKDNRELRKDGKTDNTLRG